MPAIAGVSAGAIAAGVSAAGTVGSLAMNLANGGPSGTAAGQQVNAANNAAGVQQNMFNQTQANLSPWMSSGQNALNSLNYMMGYGMSPDGSANPWGVGNSPLTNKYADFSFDPNSVASSPLYQFAMSQGTGAIMNNMSRLGGVGGNQLQALQNFGQGTAMQYEPVAFNQALQTWQTNAGNQNAWQNRVFSELSGISGAGQNAAANLGGLGANAANAIGSDIMGAGNAQAAGTIGSANAVAGGLNSLGNQAQNYILQNQMLSQTSGNPSWVANQPGYQQMANNDPWTQGGYGT